MTTSITHLEKEFQQSDAFTLNLWLKSIKKWPNNKNTTMSLTDRESILEITIGQEKHCMYHLAPERV